MDTITLMHITMMVLTLLDMVTTIGSSQVCIGTSLLTITAMALIAALILIQADLRLRATLSSII